MNNCINCGIEIPKNANYCPKCGAAQIDYFVKECKNDKVFDFLLHKILQIKLGEDYSNFFDNHVDYLEGEFSTQFSGLLNLISGTETAIKECKETLEILEMYNSIISSSQTLTDKKELDDEKIAFPGFDSTGETSYYHYACFFLKTLNCFKEVQKNLKKADLDSHCTTLSFYKDMLKKWNEIKADGISVYNMPEHVILELLKINI